MSDWTGSENIGDNISGEEQVVFRPASAAVAKFNSATPKRYYCTNCNKNIHGYVTESGAYIDRCTRSARNTCECRCRHMYVCRYGRLHKHNTPCSCDVSSAAPERQPDPATDRLIEAANKLVRENREKSEVKA